MASLYDRLGGRPAIEALADVLYDRIFAEKELQRFFEGIERTALEEKQITFLSHIFGGPQMDHEIDMRAVHRPLIEEKGMNEDHFNMIAGMVQSVLEEMHVDPLDVEEAMGDIAAFKDDILCR